MAVHDAIIIGAGSIGVPAALALARAGLKVLVFDARPSPGQGANKSAIGGVRATHSDPAKIRIAQRSLEVFSTWHRVMGDDIHWQSGGYVFVAYREEDAETLKALLKVQRGFGLNIDWLAPEALAEVVPGLTREGLRGGTYAPEDGHCSTLLATHAFYRAAVRAGAEFRFHEPVTAICTSGDRVTGVRTERGRYRAPVVINAAGARAKAVADLAEMSVPVTADAHEAGITEPVAPFLAPMVVDIRPETGSANTYFYQARTGQILFCLTPSPPLWGEDTRETSAFLPLVARRLVALMPRLRHLRVRRTWRGLYPMTPDGMPIVGWAREVEGLLFAVGMCGQGFMLGPGVGELLARMVQGTVSAEDEATLAAWSPYRSFAGEEKLK
jgi:sarcosine oxidase subunit beta